MPRTLPGLFVHPGSAFSVERSCRALVVLLHITILQDNLCWFILQNNHLGATRGNGHIFIACYHLTLELEAPPRLYAPLCHGAPLPVFEALVTQVPKRHFK